MAPIPIRGGHVVGDDGETWHVSSTFRTYKPILNQWELITVDGASGLHNFGTAQRVGSEMHLEWALYEWTHPSPEAKPGHYHEVVRLLAAAGASMHPEWLQEDTLRGDARMLEALGPQRPR